MKGLKTYLVVGGIILVLYIIAQFNRPQAIDWTETLSSKDKIPFGTYILRDRARDIFPGSHIVNYREPVYNVLVDDSAKNSSYVIICPQIDLSKVDYEKLTAYIKKGNDVFISAESFGQVMEKKLGIKTEVRFGMFGGFSTPVNFVSPHLDSAKHYVVDKGITNIYFNDFDTAKAVVLGSSSSHNATFLKFNFGKGALYLASNPKLFSNYSLLKTDGVSYAATALSFVKNTPKLLWDTYYTQGDDEIDSPMRVFLSHTYLKWAYYITIFSLLLFVLYDIKRRQRIIPVIKPLNNSTLEFVNVIGQLYYEKRNNANIAHKQILYLLTYLRDEYQLKYNKLDNEFAEMLAAKLNIDAEFARKLVNFMQYINLSEHVNDKELIELNKLIEQFYIKSR